MDCPGCKHENPADANFCLKCGTALTRACARCGTEFPAEAAFCMACGHDLSQGAAAAEPTGTQTPESPAPTGERRQATVLFSDLSGYTALNERLDPEEVERIMSRIKAEAVRIVEGHGGTVNQFVGDEVLALFGIPTANEDDPRRAVNAALALHELARELSAEVEAKIGGPLRMHSGINTGLVVTHSRDDREGRYGITGDSVNTAARLVAQASADEVLLSPETWRLVAPFVDAEPLEPIRMKGKANPVTPYRVRGETGVATRFEAARARGFTAHTGRAAELATLHRALEKTIAGQGQLVTVVGEAGLGKSRLFHEFRQGLHQDRVAVMEGQCQAQGRNTPYLPLRDAIRSGLGLSPQADPAEQLRTALATFRGIDRALEPNEPVLLHLLSIASAAHRLPESLQGKELRQAVQLAISALVTLSAARKPLVLLLEDWHWADEASDAALKYLVGVMAHTPLLLLVNYRPEFSGDWDRHSHHTQLSLQPLEAAESAEIVKSALDADVLPAGLAELIHERAAGNPYFTEEICRALLEQGAVEVRGLRKAALTRSLENLAVPDSVQAVIRSRLDRLQGELRDVLGLAAVVGREFSGGVLERLHPDAALLTGCLEHLKALELIQQVRLLPDAGYVFKQAVIQQVTYESLLLSRRKTLHRCAAEATEALYAERLAEFSEALGYHYRQGEVWAKAAGYYLAAGETAKTHHAYQSALGLCRRALEAAEEGEGLVSQQGEALALRGDLLSLLGQLEPANLHYEQALALAGEPERRRWIENKFHRRRETRRDKARLVYYEHGAGEETLLFVHPNAYNPAAFQPIVEQLCQSFRIVTMDPRGAGGSDPIDDPYPLAERVEDTRAVIGAFTDKPVIAVGISRSATQMVKLATTYPELVKKAVLVGTNPDDMGPNGFAAPDIWNKGLQAALDRKDIETVLKLFAPTVISEPGTEEILTQYIDDGLSKPPEILLNHFRPDPSADIIPFLHRVHVPMLVMHGTEDRRVPLHVGRYICDHIPGARFYPLVGRGHQPMVTAPGEFCEVLRHFVRTGEVPSLANGS